MSKAKKKPRLTKRRKRRLALVIAATTMAVFIVVQVSLYYFATPLLSTAIRKFVQHQTGGLYEVSFNDIRIDMSARSFHLISLELRPNKAYYWQLRDSGKIQTALYQIGIPELELNGIDSYSLFRKQLLFVEEIKLRSPVVKLVASPKKIQDTTRKPIDKKALHRDLYLNIAPYVKALAVNTIKVENGFFNLQRKQYGSAKTSASSLDVILHDFRLNRENYTHQDRLFFADDIEIRLDRYTFNLSDSTHLVTAENIRLTTKGQQVAADNIALYPGRVSKKARSRLNKNLLDVFIPRLTVTGVDFTRAFFENEIDLRKAELHLPGIRIYRQARKKQRSLTDSLTVEEAVRLDLYALIKDKIQFIALDTLHFFDASIQMFKNQAHPEPTLAANSLTVQLEGFRLDSLSAENQEKIFYSDQIMLSLEDYIMQLSDSIHILEATEVMLSTEDHKLDARGVKLSPVVHPPGKSQYYINIPGFRIHGLDLYSFYHQKELPVSQLFISYPDLHIRHVQKADTSRQPRFNANDLYLMTSGFLHEFSVSSLRMQQGELDFSSVTPGQEPFLAKGQLSLRLQDFRLSPQTVFRSDKLFNARNLDFSLSSLAMEFPGLPEQLTVDKLDISTRDSSLFLSGVSFLPDTLNTGQTNRTWFALDSITLRKADIAGIYFDDIIEVEDIYIAAPQLFIQQTASTGASATDTFSRQSPWPLQKDTAWVASKMADTSYRAYHYIPLYAGRDTFYRFLDTLPAPQWPADTIESLTGLPLPGDTLLKSAQTLQTPLIPFRPKGLDETVLHALLPALSQSRFVRMQFGQLDIRQGFMDVRITDTTGQMQSHFQQNFRGHIDSFFLVPQTAYKNRQPLFSKNFRLCLQNGLLQQTTLPYNLAFDTLHINTQNDSLAVVNFQLSPAHADGKMSIGLPFVLAEGLKITELYQDGKLQMQQFRVRKPDISLTLPETPSQPNKQDTAAGPALPGWIDLIALKQLGIDTANLNIYKKQGTGRQKLLQTQAVFRWDSIRAMPTHFQALDTFMARQQINIELLQPTFYTPDGIYTLHAAHVGFSSVDSAFRLSKLTLAYPDTLNFDTKLRMLERNGKRSLIQASLPSLAIGQANLQEMLLDKKFRWDTLQADSLRISAEIFSLLPPKPKRGPAGRKPYQYMPGIINQFALQHLQSKGNALSLTQHAPDTTRRIRLEDVSLLAEALQVDTGFTQWHDFPADDIQLRVKGYQKALPSSFYTLGTEEIFLSTGKNLLRISNPSLWPELSLEEQSAQLPRQGAVIDFNAKSLELHRIDWQKLIEENAFFVDKISVDSAQILVFKDKNIPVDSTKQLPNVQALFALEKPMFYIDTLKADDSYVHYKQKMAETDSIGQIEIHRMQVTGYDLTNDSAFKAQRKKIPLRVSLWLENQGLLRAKFLFDPGSPHGAYAYTGTLDTFRVSALNPYLVPTTFVRITGGKVQKTEFEVFATDTLATGKIKMRYEDLQIALLDKEEGSQGERKNMLSSMANTVLRNDNPRYKWLPPRTGHVYFRPLRFYPVFHYWISSLVSGMKSTLGFESKELKKELKRRKRAAKRREALKLQSDSLPPDPTQELKERLDFE